MSHKSTDVRTPGIVAIAKKWKLPVAKVMELVNQGAEVEKEHNKSIVKARQVARDHINERPDYYNKLKKMEKTPISVKEETGISGVRGLGYVSGDPGVDPVQSYININSMAYEDENGNKLDMIKKKHLDYHNSKLGFNFFDPTDGNASNKTLKEAKHPLQMSFDKYRKGKLNELGGNIGYEGLTDAPPRERKELVKEGPKLDKAKKVAMAGMTAANMYTMSDVMSRANEGGRGSPKGDIVKVASALPGAAGWGATAVHYGKKGYDLARDALKKKKAHMEEEKKMSNPCWKGYKAYGMKKKDGKEVPNCVPVEEQGSSATPYIERPTYESAAWQRKAGKNPEGGLNRKGIASYRKEHPGSKLSMAVTTKPSKLKPGSKAANRRKSFCARMGGMPGPMKDEKGRPTRKALSLRKWNCEEENNALPQTTQRGIYEKAPPGAKYERMVRHIKDRLGADGLTDKEKGIAFATAWKAKNREHMKEDGFDTDAVANAIRDKESGTSGGYNAKSKSSSASGAYQYINKTWKGSASKYGVDTKQFPTARSAPKEVQDKVFMNDLQKNANKYGGLEKAVNVHYTGNPGGKVSAAGLKANRGQTGGGYMDDIKKRVDDYNTERKSTMGAAQQMAANFSGGSKSLSTPDSTQFAKAPEAPKPTQVASAPETPKMQNPDQNITKVASAPAPTQVSQLDTKDKKQIAEISDTLVGKMSNARFFRGEAPSERLERYIKRAQLRDPEEKKEKPKKKSVKENSGQKDWDDAVGPMGKFAEQTYFHPTHKHTARLSKEKAMKPDNIIEPGGVKGHVSPNMHTEQKETTMENQNLINEALENILENNLNDMKENLLAAINEKAMEKLEERKKAIAADYFAQ